MARVEAAKTSKLPGASSASHEVRGRPRVRWPHQTVVRRLMAVPTAEAQTPGQSGMDLTACGFLLNQIWGELDMRMLRCSLVGALDPDQTTKPRGGAQR